MARKRAPGATQAIPARPTMYKGVRMRSRLEADYAGALDRAGREWKYEPTCFAGPDAQWLPDFRTSFGDDPTETYVEVKPAGIMRDLDAQGGHAFEEYVDEILTQMSVAWLSEPSAVLMLAFWTYGADDADFAVLGMHGIPWQAWNVSGYGPLLWPGMGQLLALARTHSNAGSAA
jgi:hypothetical protein